jgi:hypothetical protein
MFAKGFRMHAWTAKARGGSSEASRAIPHLTITPASIHVAAGPGHVITKPESRLTLTYWALES